ncbi:MAG: glycoside hydrolase family 31 protein [Chloroflexi bacterium]|nr:glycoside hydrolase family 31 protein [Chloroflexota bacterium]
MIFQHPFLKLWIKLEPDRMTLFRGDIPVLVALQKSGWMGSREGGGSLLLKMKESALLIDPTAAGFDFTFSPSGSISFLLEGDWFGHGELLNQRLPLNRLMLFSSVMNTYDNGPAGQSSKLTPAWFSSKGILITADTPVSVGINQPPIEYPRYHWSMGRDRGPFKDRPFEDPGSIGDGSLTLSGEDLRLSVSVSENALEAYHHMIAKFGHAHEFPPEELFRNPTWTTWARYKTEINQEKVLGFADEIISNDYPYGVIEIDDRWQRSYGDIAFDPSRFPDPAGMIAELHQKGFKVTVWVIPFLDPVSNAFEIGSQRNFLVKDHDGKPYLVPWWQGRGGLLDVTNPQALEWFRDNLCALQKQTGLDGFKFDAGEACFVPEDGVCAAPISSNEYTHRYIEFIAKEFKLTEVRSGWLNQQAPIFFRQWDKWSSWGADNGLYSVLSGILALSLTGYPFILPDMVGGNAYDDQPDDELMIRWTQLNALLPAMQFSLPPWDFSRECNDICRRYAKLHLDFSDTLIDLARNSTRTGDPIIRPIWWGTPHDEQALSCDDQFLVGDQFLVAPVLKAGGRSRDIYLPQGRWRNLNNDQTLEGPKWLHDFPAPLDYLPLFEKVG